MGGAGPSRAGLSYQHGETYVSQEQLVEFLATQTRLVSQVCRLVELQEDHETWLVTLLGRVDLISERQANKHRMLGFANTFALQLIISDNGDAFLMLESRFSLLLYVRDEKEFSVGEFVECDILCITGFPIDGKPVTGVDPSDVSNACLTFLGKSPEDLTLKKRNIRLNWLKTNFEFVEDELDSMTNTLKKKSNEMVELFYSLMVFALERIPTLVEKLGCNDAQNVNQFPLVVEMRYTTWGERMVHRPAEDLALAVARFFERLLYGKPNEPIFRWDKFWPNICGIFSYDYDAPMDEYGLLSPPKWGHLKDVHAAIKLSEPALVVAVDSPQVGTIAGGLFDFLTSF
ncbi:hypothetical protein Dimus_029858 [Dionaea muscipula]